MTKLGIAGQTPAGWQLSHHTGYAETIVAMLHPDRSHISVTASPTEATSSRALFDLSRPGLEAQSLVVEAVSEHGAWLQIDIRSADGQRRLRQLYRVRTAGIIRQAIILTLSTSQMAFKSHTGDLDYAAEALEFSEPTDPRYARPDSAGAPDAGQR